ncbi:MAG TPA: NAD(P)/FAD-dependent oxidoreductase [Bryobacteraceae bacterium]|nr:NAD(P)/FAD-dependent oxidoreductase [Bryobacteraceae bacterium]
MDWDVVVVGGGPAGLSAALMLGRCRRKVLVVDAGKPRNRRAAEAHGYLTRDCIQPLELLRLGRQELTPYGVEFRHCEALDASRLDGGAFETLLAGGERVRSTMLLIATGVVDHIPEIEGIQDFYGTSVHHCPYCDGWEERDRPIAVYGKGGKSATGLALALKTWSADVVLCTDGPGRLGREEASKLAREGIPIRAEKIARLEGSGGRLQFIVFQTGSTLEREALFFSTGQRQRSGLAEKLGCEFNDKGTVRTNIREATNVPGLYVAGDASKDVQFVIVAAAEGAKAAVAINKALQEREGLKP